MNIEQLKSVPKGRMIETVRQLLLRLLTNDERHIDYLKLLVMKNVNDGMTAIECRHPHKGIHRDTLLDLWVASSNMMPIVREGKHSQERHAEVVELYEMCAELAQDDTEALYNVCYRYTARVLCSN
jgi:hypothetical protein